MRSVKAGENASAQAEGILLGKTCVMSSLELTVFEAWRVLAAQGPQRLDQPSAVWGHKESPWLENRFTLRVNHTTWTSVDWNLHHTELDDELDQFGD